MCTQHTMMSLPQHAQRARVSGVPPYLPPSRALLHPRLPAHPFRKTTRNGWGPQHRRNPGALVSGTPLCPSSRKPGARRGPRSRTPCLRAGAPGNSGCTAQIRSTPAATSPAHLAQGPHAAPHNWCTDGQLSVMRLCRWARFRIDGNEMGQCPYSLLIRLQERAIFKMRRRAQGL